tara:strand:- start:1591 stop:2154 length:564 start_codon:yes stop_codon:yes gene_type:complete
MSDQQILIIHKFDAMFNILDELRKYFSFQLKSINSDKIDHLPTEKNYLIISSNQKLDLNNQIKIKEFPIDIIKLTELININFLKNKFNQQNNIKIGSYFINSNSRLIINNGNKLPLTEKETKIIIFLSKSKKPISITDLQKQVWGHKSKLETHTVETHIYRLRKKIQRKFEDIKFISSVKGGYKINA